MYLFITDHHHQVHLYESARSNILVYTVDNVVQLIFWCMITLRFYYLNTNFLGCKKTRALLSAYRTFFQNLFQPNWDFTPCHPQLALVSLTNRISSATICSLSSSSLSSPSPPTIFWIVLYILYFVFPQTFYPYAKSQKTYFPATCIYRIKRSNFNHKSA